MSAAHVKVMNEVAIKQMGQEMDARFLAFRAPFQARIEALEAHAEQTKRDIDTVKKNMESVQCLATEVEASRLDLHGANGID